MLALVRKSAAALFVAAWLAPFPHALPAGGEEDSCVHLVGYGGPAQRAPAAGRAAQPLAPGGPGGDLAAGVCAVDNARFNTASPIKTSADFVPITGDDSLGFYCVYGVRASTTGGVAGNVGIYLLELAGGEVLVFGSGYGNIAGANLFDAAYDMARVDQVIRFCMGRLPAQTPLRLLAPHGHGDHINPACNRELERLGYRIVEITFHAGDLTLLNAMAWTTADRALFRMLPASTSCLQELASYSSPLGKLWVYDRPGHTAGSIDLVIDVKNDPTNRFVVRGSQPSTPCATLPGQREAINAHGNVELLSVPPKLTDVTPLSGTSLGGTPLTLTGLDFTAAGAGTPSVLVDGKPATNVVVVGDTTLTCLTPSGPPGQLVEVAVVTNNGKSVYAGTFFYNALPTLTSIFPTSGNWRGGTTVQVRGSGFLLTSGVNEVFFGAKKATSLSIKSDTLLTCRTPSGTAGTTVAVMVSNPNGQATLDSAFRYNFDLSITAAEPASATSLGGTSVLLTGTSFTGNGATPTVTVGGEVATGVTLLSDTSLSFVVPAGTPGTAVDILLTNSAGSAIFSGFRYHAVPDIAAIAPASGRASGGTLVTLSGSGFLADAAGANQVRFGGVPAGQVSVLADDTLTCLAPAGAAGTEVNVTVTNDNGTGTLPVGFTYFLPFELVAVEPPSGSADGGTLVTLLGSGFVDGPAGTNTVLFGGVPATGVSALDDGTLTCLAPAGTPLAVVDVAVTNAHGTVTLPGGYRYNARPTLTGVAPDHGHAGSATPVTLSGTGFQAGAAGAAQVRVGGIAATQVVVVSDTQLTCLFPPGTPGAVVDVVLTNANGTAGLTSAFRYHTPPSVTSVTPTSGAASSQPRVTLTGTGFLNDSAGPPVITFGGLAATAISVQGDQTLRCNAPAGTPGTMVDVVLSNARGTGTLVKGYRYHARPTVTSLVPNRGSSQGGTQVTLTGTGFQIDGAGTNVVTIGGALAANVVVQSDSALTCTTPPGTLNAVVDVVVSNANGTGTLVQGFSYSVPAPTVLAVTPASGPAHAPGAVEITGSGFLADGAGASSVRFGGVAATGVTVLDDARLTCQVPLGAPGTTVAVSVTNANGTGQLAGGFRYHALPALTSLSPAAASALGGSTVQLTGSGFASDSAGTNVVTFAGVPAANVVVVSNTLLTCVLPAGTPGTSVEVRVANANGTSAPRPFAYFAAPSLAAVTPDFGPATGGTRLTLSGLGFLANGAGPAAVSIGGRPAANVLVLNDTTLECDTPRGSPGFVDVALANANGTALLPDGYHYGRLPPVITAVEPASGPARGQTVVTLRGRGFQEGNAGLNRVKFGEVFASNVITLDDQTVLCTAPAGPHGALVDVAVNNNFGTGTLPQAFRYHARPTLTAVDPPEGRPLGETRVTLVGSGFQIDDAGPPTVLFGSVRARDARVVDDAHIVCTAVGGSPGTTLDVTVRNANGAATLPEAYRVVGGPPGIRAIRPDTGPFVGGTRVEIEGSGFAAGALRLAFGGVPASAVVVASDTFLTCLTPPGPLGASVTVSLSTKDGSAAFLGGFTYGPILPRLTAVAPNHGPAAGATSVTLTGSGFRAEGAGTTRVRFGEVAAGNVVVLDDATVTCQAPPGVAGTRVDVVLENDFGSSHIVRAFRYHDEPELTALTPATGRAAGGTRVTLTGAGFLLDEAGPNVVRFGSAPALDVVVVSDQLLTCTTPPGASGATVDVKLGNRNGLATLPGAFRYLVVPEIEAVSPARGPRAGGTELTLSGRGFQSDSAGPNQVTIGGVPALAVTTLDDATITCVAPPSAASGPADVVVSNANGSGTAPGAFVYFRPPELTGIEPARGPAEGGTAVTLSGLGFLEATPGTNLVLFGGVAAIDVLELTDTALTCTTPPGTPGATVDVTLASENGIATLTGAFRYHAGPVVAAVSPDHGPATGATVTLTGSGFLEDGAGPSTVTFGALAATQVAVVDDATLTCRAPAGTPGAVVDVTVANANGAGTLPSGFRYHREPTLTGVAPNRGPAAGGTSVTLTGTGFQVDSAGKPLVLFGGLAAANIVVVSDTTVTCTSPGGNPNTQVNVTLSNDNGTAVRTGAFRYNPLPSLVAVTPASGSAEGGTAVTLTGSGFGANNPGANTVLFGATPATAVTLVNDTTLTCVAPAGAAGTTVDVRVDNANGPASLAAAYRFNPVPTLAALQPASGTALGGTRVILTGTGFADANAGATQVSFGGLAASDVVVLDDGRVECTAPSGPAGVAVDVRLANANGEAALAAAFRYHAVPTLGAVLPTRGSSAVSSLLTLSGSGFQADDPGPCTVLFGAEAAANVVVVGDDTLTCEVAPQPPGSVVDVSVSNRNGSALLAAAFAFDAPPPTLAGLAPASGFAAGGTSVTLTGSGFQAFSAGLNAVTFGGAPASDVTVVDDATLKCLTPPGTVGATVDVAVTNANGSAQLAAAFTYLAHVPTLTSVSPASGKAEGGGLVTLLGSGFQADGAGAHAVTFGDVPAGNVSVLDDTRLTCLVPPGAAGSGVKVVVTNGNGSAELVDGYRYHAVPAITSISPVDGTSLGGTLVTVRGSGFLNDSPGTNQVRFGNNPASAVVVYEDGRLTCRAPSGPAGTIVTLTLTNQNGTTQLPNAYRYHARPTLTEVTPASGPRSGGNRVTLTGTGFLADGAVVNIVTFGGVSASGVTVVNDRTIQCNVPAGTAGLSVQVTVANVNGTALLASGYRYHASPTLTALAPVNGLEGGGTLVTLTGSGFLVDSPGPNAVTFGGVGATEVTVIDDASLTCLTPPGTGGTTVDVALANANGAATLSGAFTYDAPTLPLVTAALPGKGTTQGSTSVTLTGSGFLPGMTVHFGSSPAQSVTVVDARTLTCLTPPSADERWVDVTVTNIVGSTTLPLAFRYLAPPTLLAVEPSVGLPEGGEMVVLAGRGFLDDAGTNSVTFGGLAVLDVVALDDEHLACVVPEGPVLEEAEVAVVNERGEARLARAFRWQHALATDLDRDGRGDLVLGSPGDDASARDAGAVHLFFGTPLPLAARTSARADLTAIPAIAATSFGTPVLSGDLDGDGQVELLIGAPTDDQLARDSGAVFVFSGPLNPSTSPLVASAADRSLVSARPNDRFGSALALHDLDRNGFLDLLVGAPGRTPGSVFVFLGSPTGLPAEADFVLNGEFGNEGHGSSLAAGDLDGDGWPEVLVGAQNALGDPDLNPSGNTWRPGEVRVYRGGLGAFSGSPLPWLLFSGSEDLSRFGATLAVEDFSGDGIDDLAVGAPASSRTGSASGAVFVFLGRGDLASTDTGGAEVVLDAEGPGDALGGALATGFVDADEIADLLVGAPGLGGMGRAYLVLGSSALVGRSIADAEGLLLAETGSSGEFGATVAMVDVDGDGSDDLVVTAPRFDGELGRVYVFDGATVLGGRDATSSDGTLTGRNGGDRLGQAVTGDH